MLYLGSEYSSSFENPAFCFKWREHAGSGNQRASNWESISDEESDEEETSICSSSDREALRLPPRVPLKIEDVKSM